MQDYTNYKVIVIDDASTDGTGDAILKVLQSQNKMKPEKYRVIIQK
jgi:glycosyltransferase involved in cell wall biosynthesis